MKYHVVSITEITGLCRVFQKMPESTVVATPYNVRPLPYATTNKHLRTKKQYTSVNCLKLQTHLFQQAYPSQITERCCFGTYHDLHIHLSSQPTHSHGLFCRCIVKNLQKLTAGLKDTQKESLSGTATPSYFLTLPGTEKENLTSQRGKAEAGEAAPPVPSSPHENKSTERAARIKASLLMGTHTTPLTWSREGRNVTKSRVALLHPGCSPRQGKQQHMFDSGAKTKQNKT